MRISLFDMARRAEPAMLFPVVFTPVTLAAACSCAAEIFEPVRVASVRVALVRVALVRVAPVRFASARSAPVRAAPVRLAAQPASVRRCAGTVSGSRCPPSSQGGPEPIPDR